MMPRVEPAAALDLAALCALLDAAHLPTAGVAPHLRTALVAREAGEIVGGVALEQYGDLALVRSLVVTPSRHGHGVGQQLVCAALELARKLRVQTVYLLTTTAADFFARHFGFRPIPRGEVPTPVQQSVEFVSACPTTAQAMVLDVSGPGELAARPRKPRAHAGTPR